MTGVKPVVTPRQRLRRILQRLGDLLPFAVVIPAAAIGLSHLASLAPRPVTEHKIDNRGGAGFTVHSQVIHVWLPEPLVKLAKRETRSLVVHSHQELRKTLERKGDQGLWYALTIRGNQVNGDFADITFIRQPYCEPQNLQEFLDVLATAAARPPRSSAVDYSTAKVHVTPKRMSRQELLEVIQTSPLRLDTVPSGSDPWHG
jgi:hypothetical protein